MQQYTPYFPTTGYGNQQDPQQQQQQQQQQPQQAAQGQAQDPQQQQAQQPQQQTSQPPQAQPQPQLPMNGPNLAIYSGAAMQPLSVLATPVKPDPQQPQQPGMPVVPTVDLGAHGKPKRKQVKNACVNCQKACKKCDEGRPCQRCIKYGLTDTCVNSVRKERKKGIKRGPYKKRNKNVNPESATTSGTTTPNALASPMVNAAMYGQNSNVDASSMPIHYQPFTTQAASNPYAYAYNPQMMSSAYMLQGAIQQMYPANPTVLPYQAAQAAMNILTPQQQQTQQGVQQQQQQQQQQDQSSVVNNGYRPQDQQQMGSASTDVMNQNGGSAVGTPNAASGDITKVEDEDEGSKLNLLSQLCSAVLKDRNDLPKQEVLNNTTVGTSIDGTTAAEPASSLPVEFKQEETHQNTPPPSGPHTREPSQENSNNTNNNSNSAASSLVLPGGGSSVESGNNNNNNNNSMNAQTYANGSMGQATTGAATNTATTTSTVSTPTSAAYGTPGSSPADSPALNKPQQTWNAPSDQQQPTTQENTAQQQQQTQ